MRYFEAPDDWNCEVDEVSLFLGGGITSCPDWQRDVTTELADVDQLVIVNPRRQSWDIEDPDAGETQIWWEFEALERVHVRSFWFPKETLCPITLYELGAWTRRAPWLVVGVHEEYARAFDVRTQTRLSRQGIDVATGFEEYVGKLHELVTRLADPAMARFK